jgi:hypothetical protein
MDIQAARAAALFALITKTDPETGLATEVRVPGHEGRSYIVKLSRSGDGMTIVYKCFLDEAGSLNYCLGCRSGNCYHAGAAVIRLAKERKATVAWPRGTSYRAATATKNLNGGHVFKIKSLWSGKRAYGVWK